jgi:hypothetical protein
LVCSDFLSFFAFLLFLRLSVPVLLFSSGQDK